MITEDKVLKPDMVDRDERPRLFEMLSIVKDKAYVLSREILSDLPGDEKLIVVLIGENNFLLIEDTPKNGGDDEVYRAILVDETAKDILASIISPVKIRKESPGRPRIYTDDTARELFVANFFDNVSIKKLSFKKNMSPTTIQKLLNEYRMNIAEAIIAGEDITVIKNDDKESKLKIIEWAISKKRGDERRRFEQFYFNLSK